MTTSQEDRTWAETARAQFPHLTSYGYGLPDGCEDEWKNPLSDECVEQIIVARNFLTKMTFNKQVSYGSRNSYSSPTAIELKTLISDFDGIYVHEGDIILAASALGAPIRNYEGHHAQIGVSRRQYNAVKKVVDYNRTHRP